MSTKIYEIIPYQVEALKWEKDNWEEVVEFFKVHNTEIKNIVKYSEKALESFKKFNKTCSTIRILLIASIKTAKENAR